MEPSIYSACFGCECVSTCISVHCMIGGKTKSCFKHTMNYHAMQRNNVTNVKICVLSYVLMWE